MADLYLLKYNNLYNKIIKKENTLSAYQNYQIGQTVQNVNFNPNDGVDTEQVINWEYGIPDYVVVGEGGNTIISRWFVVEATRLRTRQFRMVLRRDLIADNYDAVRNSTCFIESGVAEQWKNLCYIYNALDATQNGLPINTLSGLGTQEGYNALLQEQGKIIAVGSTEVKRINAYTGTASKDISPSPIPAKGTELYAEMLLSMVTEPGMDYNDSTVDIHPQLRFPHNGYRTIYLSYTDTQSGSVSYKFDYTEGAVTTDSVYEIIATPYNDTEFIVTEGGATTFKHSGSVAVQWFQDIINRYNSAGFAYDLQLVPYCPIDVTNISNYSLIYASKTSKNIAVAIKLPRASFSLQYDLDIDYNSDPKISNETELFRFVSPNGISEYEFSPAKNKGLTGYEVDCTLIPFNPYIKINPIFGGLYGEDFNDYRGLICGGDFSLPILSNAWETYQLNNKYYQDIFNRKIESQEYNNKWQLASDITGALVGAGAGAAAGSMIGGPVGAIAGGVLSAAGGALDVVAGQATFREGIQAQKDLFGYELGTIKARAETLTRTTSYNINNKYFPYIEYYTCTDEEITALKNKLKYNGMSIGVIGKLEDYLNPTETSYIQGDLIEIDVQEEYHAVSEIANILKRGVRFYVD